MSTPKEYTAEELVGNIIMQQAFALKQSCNGQMGAETLAQYDKLSNDYFDVTKEIMPMMGDFIGSPLSTFQTEEEKRTPERMLIDDEQPEDNSEVFSDITSFL